MRFLLVVVPLLGLAAPSRAQERVELRGQVVSSATGEPVQGAQVMAPLSERRVLTDSLGDYSISFIRDSRYELVVGALGYESVRFTVGPEAHGSRMTIQMVVDPQAMAALEVLEDRLEQRRRRRLGRRIRLVEHDELAESTESTAYALVRRLASAIACADQRDLCRRGRSRVRLCIDDSRPNAGARELEEYDPSDLWLIEVFNNGAEVRVYSRWFVDQVVRTRQGEIRSNPIC